MSGLRDKAKATAAKTDEQLSDIEARVLVDTVVDLPGLKPQVSDKASFDALVAAVDESTRRNESLAQLKQRLTSLGTGVLRVAKEVSGLLGPLPSL
jgi:hypothetical protein